MLNKSSSRSHSILIIYSELKTKTENGYTIKSGKLNLIDLAGSENNKKTGNQGIRMTESTNINKSLLALGKVINALVKNQRVPYRDSKLTRFLQDSLGGNSLSVLIANIASSYKHFQETNNTLNFASKSRQIVNKPISNFQHLSHFLENSQISQLDSLCKQNSQNKLSDKQSLLSQLISDTLVCQNNEQIKEKLRMIEKILLSNNENVDSEKEDEKGRDSDQFSFEIDNEQSYQEINFMTPLSKSSAVKQIILEARNLEKTGEFQRSLTLYRHSLKFAEEKHKADIHKKIDRLSLKAKSTDDNPQQKMLDFDSFVDFENKENFVNISTRNKSDKISHKPSKKLIEITKDEDSDDSDYSASDEEEAFQSEIQKNQKKTKSEKETHVMNVLNNGTLKEIMTLHFVGKKRAELIVDHRPFNKISDLDKCLSKKILQNFIEKNLF